MSNTKLTWVIKIHRGADRDASCMLSEVRAAVMLNAEIPSERLVHLRVWITCALARPSCTLAFRTARLEQEGQTCH